MLTEGWDCNTVTHIVGLRPFMSQLLCEQVVGRGLRRRTYELGDDGRMTEEVAKVFGVPFEVIPFKANPTAAPTPQKPRHHVYAMPGRQHLRDPVPAGRGLPAGHSQPSHRGLEEHRTAVSRPDQDPARGADEGLAADQHGPPIVDGPGKS